jgi:hypothetical protein
MVGVPANVRRHRLVALQTRCIRIHLRFQLRGARPIFQTGLARGVEMHFVAGNAGKFSSTKTGRRLHAVKLSARHPNHAVVPESTPKKLRLSPADEILFFGVIRRLWLNDETLSECAPGRKALPWRLKSILSDMLLKAQTLWHWPQSSAESVAFKRAGFLIVGSALSVR